MISQREARRLKKQVTLLKSELNRQRNAWIRDWPNGVNIASLDIPTDSYTAIHTARKLSHAVVVTTDRANCINFYALKLAEV
jgi:hypothetical protein